MSNLAIVIQHIIGSPHHSNKIRKKKWGGIQTGKEVTLSMFANGMIIPIENPKDIINEFGKVAGSK